MKLGLISDIHADYGALVSAINRLETVHNLNEILCAGDLTGYGTQPDEVIALIRDRSITTVRGNHDSPSVETHVLCQKVNETWILNPGSVFTQSDGGTSDSYGVLDLSRAEFLVYDVLRPPLSAPISTYILD